MITGGMLISSLEYPGKISLVIFTGGCILRCPYCHNPCLVFDPESQPEISRSEVFSFLEKRKNKLDGVVVSGGEPCLRHGLSEFVKEVKEMGFLVKLDTNGSFPEKVIECFNEGFIDALGIDYKAPENLYNKISYSSVPDFAHKVQSLIQFAVNNHIHVDIRTTVHKKLLSHENLKSMRNELNHLGIKKWTLQQFHPVEIIDDGLLDEPTYSDVELMQIAKSLGNGTQVRGLKGIFINYN